MSMSAQARSEVAPKEDALPDGASARPALPRFAGTAVARARLSLVAPARSEAPMAPFVVLLFVLLAGGVAGLLAFNTSMQQASFTATRLEQKATALEAEQQSLQIDLQNLRDPQNLAARAKKLGMVPSLNPAFVRLSDGSVVGDPQPARGDAAMPIYPAPVAKPEILDPAPRVVKPKPGTVPSGSDRPVQSTTGGNEDGSNAR